MRKVRIDLERLRGATARKGRELSKVLSIHEGSFSRKIHGKTPVTLDDLNAIADHLGTDADRFIEIYETETPEGS